MSLRHLPEHHPKRKHIDDLIKATFSPTDNTIEVFDDRSQRILDDNPFSPSPNPNIPILDEPHSTLTQEDVHRILQNSRSRLWRGLNT